MMLQMLIEKASPSQPPKAGDIDIFAVFTAAKLQTLTPLKQAKYTRTPSYS